MKKLMHYTLIIAATLVISGCEKEETLPEVPIVGLGGDTWAAGPLDDWIDQQFVSPYNIEVKYKWDPYEVNYIRNLVPVLEDRVQPVMSAVKTIWIDPYEAIAGGDFIKTYAPKQFVLAGSAEFNDNGTIVLGQAEGGRKIVLMVVNQFEETNEAEVVRMLHTIHHEFAHILHQNRMYPVEWKALNPEWYTATWFNSTDAQAHQQGLVTNYAKSSPDEDFVETISVLLVYGQAYFDALVAQPSVPESSKNILRTKETMVVDYFNREFGIDFRALQEATREAIEHYIQ